MPQGPNPEPSITVGEATRIVENARSAGIPLRMFGAAAIFYHCPTYSRLFEGFGRRPGDIDLASYEKHSSKIADLIEGLGYEEDTTVTAFGSGRLIFRRKSDGLHCDVFLGKLQMSHTISFERRLEVDYPTVPLADLLLSKMQIFKLNEKDAVDTVVLLREHPLGASDNETINTEYITQLCAKDWGLWRTLTDNLRKVSSLVQGYPSLEDADRKDVSGKVDALLATLDTVPKSFAWKMRARVGDSRKWYNEVDDLYR